MATGLTERDVLEKIAGSVEAALASPVTRSKLAAKGWSVEQARVYLTKRALLALHNEYKEV